MRLKRNWPTILGVWQILGAAFGAFVLVDGLSLLASSPGGLLILLMLFGLGAVSLCAGVAVLRRSPAAHALSIATRYGQHH